MTAASVPSALPQHTMVSCAGDSVTPCDHDQSWSWDDSILGPGRIVTSRGECCCSHQKHIKSQWSGDRALVTQLSRCLLNVMAPSSRVHRGIKGRTLAIDLLRVPNHTLGWFHVIFCVCTTNSAMLLAILYPVSRYKGIKGV